MVPSLHMSRQDLVLRSTLNSIYLFILSRIKAGINLKATFLSLCFVLVSLGSSPLYLLKLACIEEKVKNVTRCRDNQNGKRGKETREG